MQLGQLPCTAHFEDPDDQHSKSTDCLPGKRFAVLHKGYIYDDSYRKSYQVLTLVSEPLGYIKP